MSTPSYNSRLGLFDDPTLPLVATVMDVNAMPEQFTRYLHASGVDPKWQVMKCAIEKVYYRPGKHCGVLYRLALRHFSGAETDEWIYGRTVPAGTEEERFEKALAGLKPTPSAHEFLRPLPPISFWRDLNMILWVFPQDPDLETLPQSVDSAYVRQQVEANLEAFGVSANGSAAQWRCPEFYYDRIKFMPSKRCVLRYHVNLLDPSGKSHEKTFYCKIYNNGNSRYHFDMLKSAYEQLTVKSAAVNIPRPLLHFDGLHTFWQEEWPGHALLDVIDQYDWQDIFRRVALVLASFHRSPANGFDAAPDLNEVLEKADEDAAKLLRLWPQQQALVSRVLELLHATKPVFDKQEMPAVPIHGACRIEQMLARGNELALVDFDAVTLGDPIHDVAELIASLQYMGLTRGLDSERIAVASEAFYRSYAEQVPWACDRRRIGWYALAFLMTKFYSSTKNLERRALQQIETAGKAICEDWLNTVGAM
ncbi:phosphotransferase [bacterium]|nr:phosphotransferase [bacterium]